MTQEQINELRRLAQAATPGPWAVNDDPLINEGAPHLMTEDGYAIADFWGNESSLGLKGNERNAAYIAAANPAVILALIAEIDSLRDEVNGLTGELESERKRLDFSLNREGFYDHTTRVFFCDRAFKIPKPQVRIETDNFRATIDELMVQS